MGPVVVIDVVGEDGDQVSFAEDEEGVEAFAADGADPAFREGVRDRSPLSTAMEIARTIK